MKVKIIWDEPKRQANIATHGLDLADAEFFEWDGAIVTKYSRRRRILSDAEEARIQAGIADDPDNPEWTANDFRRAKPFAKTFPALAKGKSVRGSQKRPAKIAVSLRLTREVVERFKSEGPGWQARIDEVLKKAAGL